jgi:hypothetical protein
MWFDFRHKGTPGPAVISVFSHSVMASACGNCGARICPFGRDGP